MTPKKTHNEVKPDVKPRARLRVPVDYPAQFTGDEETGDGTVTNLTIAGCELKSHARLPIGAHLNLHVRTPGARPLIIIALAIVRWTKGDRCGLEFVRFEGTAKTQLKDMLNQHEGPAGK
jgi:hypothetical protein